MSVKNTHSARYNRRAVVNRQTIVMKYKMKTLSTGTSAYSVYCNYINDYNHWQNEHTLTHSYSSPLQALRIYVPVEAAILFIAVIFLLLTEIIISTYSFNFLPLCLILSFT